MIEPSPGFDFAAHFYAGHAGNKGRPTAEPSASEAEIAARYVQRLAELWPDPTQASSWGRQFGEFFREQHPQKEGGPLPSLALALRSYGDAYYHRLASRRERALQDALYRAQAAHEDAHRRAWLDYLRREEARCKSEQRKQYHAFLAERGAAKARLTDGPWRSEAAAATFAAEDNHLHAFQSAFERDGVLDFWEWDAAHNPARFNPEAITL